MYNINEEGGEDHKSWIETEHETENATHDRSAFLKGNGRPSATRMPIRHRNHLLLTAFQRVLGTLQKIS